MKNINIVEFNKEFNREYAFLYNNDGNIAGYNEAINEFDEFLKTHGSFVGKFAEYRKDFITSDREAVAFMFALEKFI